MPRFRQQLRDALLSAREALSTRAAGERLYAFALYTSGEEDFRYVCASANTEEGLDEAVQRYLGHERGADPEALRRRLRWSAADWKYHDFSDSVRALELPPGGGDSRDVALWADFVGAMRALDRRGAFGRGEQRTAVTLLVLAGDMSEGRFREALSQLNPKGVLAAYLREFTPTALFDRIGQLPDSERVATLLELYQDLALGRSTPAAEEARRFSASQHDVLEELKREGGRAVPALLRLVAEHLLAEPFNERGTAAFSEQGAFTRESRLAADTVLALGDCAGVTEAHIAELRRPLAIRLEADRQSEPTSTLAENIARTLHCLRPDRFPPSELDPKTNHLRNPESFLPEPSP